MTKKEAHRIYEMASAICFDSKEMRETCIKKNVPGVWLDEFEEEDGKFEAFLDMHDDDGNLKER